MLLYEIGNSAKNEVNFGLIEQYGPVGFHPPALSALNSLAVMLDKQKRYAESEPLYWLSSWTVWSATNR